MNFAQIIAGVLNNMGNVNNIQNLQNIQTEPPKYSPLAHSSQLSADWRGRLTNIIYDLQSLKDHHEKLLRQYENNAVETKETKEKDLSLDIVTFCKNSLPKIISLSKDKNKHYFNYDDIEMISNVEKQIYQFVMTEEVIKKLERKLEKERIKIEEDRIFAENEQHLVETVDNMWEDGISEEEIKQFILSEIRRIFVKSYNDKQKEILANDLFLQLTVYRNVRVFLSPAQIDKLLSAEFQASLSSCLHRDEDCPTCFEKFDDKEKEEDKEEQQRIIYLPCEGRHRYHYDCIMPWLKKSVYCPKCKCDIREKL